MKGYCGHCMNYVTRPNCEDVCALTGKIVGWLWEMDCFVDNPRDPFTHPGNCIKTNTMTSDTRNLAPDAMAEPAPQTKVCKRCGRELPIEEFGLQRNRKGELYRKPHCKACQKEIGAKGAEIGWENRKARSIAEKVGASEKETVKVVKGNGLRLTKHLEGVEDTELAAELRARGYTVTARKTITIDIDL